jgi:TRAP-type C4-dicarboxylate transport system permease small subunit
MGSPSEALKMPLGYLYAVLPFTMLLVAVEAVVEIVAVLRRGPGKAAAR